VRPERSAAATYQHGLARAVDEVHALFAGACDGQDLLAQSRALQDAQHLAVEVDRAPQREHARFTLDHHHRQPRRAQQIGPRREETP
jgi:hypothetical protein